MDSPKSDRVDSNQPTKKLCPFAEKCYRKNPVHFKEMSHPHLEKLVENQLEDGITVPQFLDFECDNRELLMDQLRIIQMNMRKERGYVSQNNKIPNSPVPSIKRDMPDILESPNPKKTRELIKSQSPPRTPEPSPCTSKTKSAGDLSIFEEFNACSSQRSREETRRAALTRMEKAGLKIPFTGSRGEFDMKYALAGPYYVFLTAVQSSPETHLQPYSITFPEILDTSLGEIEESLHINFMVDVGWLCLQYLLACQSAKMLILLGERCDTESLAENIKVIKIDLPTRYGTHHSKISILRYKNGVRIVVSTANLYSDDWENRTQALWISPHLPRLSESADKIEGESQTGFKDDFLTYLKTYGACRVQHWLDVLERTDFSSIDVFFVASVPGNHKDANRDKWGMRRLSVLLSQHAELPADGSKWSIVAQSSSIGSLGANFDAWLAKNIVPALSNEKKKSVRSSPNFQFVYPSIENFKRSFDMRVGSCCLPYNNQLHAKQRWLKNYCYQWKSTDKHRDRAMPHVKSYTRISPDYKKIPWIVITSANMSKAAWGYGKFVNTILSYEAGVVFFPKFLTNSTTFPIKESDEKGTPPFPLPYDVPLTPYGSDDELFTMDFFNL